MAGGPSRADLVEDVRRARHAPRTSEPHRQQRRAPEPSVAEHLRQREQPDASDLVCAAGAWPTSGHEHDYVVTIPGQGYRFVATVQELAAIPAMDLDEARAGVHPYDAFKDSSSRSTKRSKSLALVAAGCGLLAAGMAVALLRRPPETDPGPRPTLQRITYDEAALPRDASWAPDSQWVVYASDRAGNADLWKQHLGNPDPTRLTTSEANESQPQWSPDGKSIVFRSERDGGGLDVIPSSGGVERIVSSFGYEPRWSPDGTRILFKRSVVLPDSPSIHVVGLDGKPPVPVRPDVLGLFSSLTAAWHPDGQRISIWATVRKGEVRFLNVPLDTGGATSPEISARVQHDLAGVEAGRFVWARSRRYIYFEGRAGDTQNVWPRHRRSAHRALDWWTRTADHRCGKRDARSSFARRHKTGLHDNLEQNEALGLPIRASQRAHHRSTESHQPREHW